MTRLITDIELTRLAEALSREGPVVLLESQSSDHPSSRKSYLAALPETEIKAFGSRVEITGKKRAPEMNPWEALGRLYDRCDGWLFGYIGYDMKNFLESLSSGNPDPVGAPDLYFMNPGLLIEAGRDEAAVLKGNLPRELRSLNGRNSGESAFGITGFGPATKRRDYEEKIREAQRRIREGEFYEINLSHQMQGFFSGGALSLYEGMKRRGPVPFGAFLSFDAYKVCCASPERFLARRAGKVFSQPIKGTIHRGLTRTEDERLKEWLRSSEKNRAENLMIVDLVRNDLGRIARKGTVKTTGLFEIQSFGTVHQMVSTVEAEAGDRSPVDILKACFPMGSMTGAPKISAMQAIEELEDYRRGLYSGCIGYMDPGGDFDFNVVIRTAIINGGRLYYSAGGAITSDSEPESEWHETLTKARALTEVDRSGSGTVHKI